jgi:protein O-GlcNAc transferase
VAPNLRLHSVAFFVAPLLKEHRRQVVEVFCYAHVLRPNDVTAHLQRSSDHWLTSAWLSDDALAERIRQDKIDILVDLAGHTANNHLRVFARKPGRCRRRGSAIPTRLASLPLITGSSMR